MCDPTVRKFELADQSEVASLYRSGMNGYQAYPITGQCYAWFVNDKLKPEGDMSNIQSVFMSNAEEKKSCFWVAVDEGKIVGCVGAVPTTKYTDDHIELVRMFVSPECRKKTIGYKLVETLEVWARDAGFKKIYLSTLADLVEPNHFYPKCGFVLTEEEEFDVSGNLNLPPPAIVLGNHYVKTL